MLKKVLFSLPAVAVLLTAGQLYADGVECGCGGAAGAVSGAPAACGYRTVVRYRHEVRTRTYNVVRMVPETRQIPQTYTVMVPEQRTKIVNSTVYKPVNEMFDVRFSVRIPQQEMRTRYRIRTRVVTAQSTRTITVRGGSWQTQMMTVPGREACGCPTCCTCCRRVWVPHCKTCQVPCCVRRVVCEKVPCQYCVTTYRCELRTRKACRTRWVPQTCSKTVNYTVCVPQKRTRTCCVTTYRCVSEPRTQTYSVCVPYTVTVPCDPCSHGCGCGCGK